MTEATQLQPVRQAAALHINSLLQAAAVTFQVGLFLFGGPLPGAVLSRLALLDRLLPDPNLLPLLVPVGHPLLH